MSDASENNAAGPLTPIFILGIFPRSGTNFLYNLLQLHPACGEASPIWEDYFLRHIDELLKYTKSVSHHWAPGRGLAPGTMESLYESFGDAIASFLASRNPQRRIVTKTPRVDNLSEFPRFFPNVRLLILMRDGRAVVESGIKTFGWHRGWAIKEWSRAAKTIRDFDQANRDGEFKYLIVKYEDLWTSLDTELPKILDFLDLDVSAYDLDAAHHLPVKGSSTVRSSAKDTMHWEPMEKTVAFDPMSRWRHWSRARHERFNWIAGDLMLHFGYELQRTPSNQWFWNTRNRVHDLLQGLLWPLRPVLGPLWRMFVQQRRQSWKRDKGSPSLTKP